MDKKDPERLGLLREVFSVIFGISPITSERMISILRNSEDIINARTNIVRNRIGARSLKLLRNAVEYARHEGSEKHETGEDDFELTKEPDIEITAKQERPVFSGDNKKMSEGFKTFKEYLMEITVDVEDPQQALTDIKKATKNPDRYEKEQLMKTIDAQREVQKSDDPDKAEKLRLLKLKQQMLAQEKRLKDKEKQQKKQMGLE